jgi:hypothetical protein
MYQNASMSSDTDLIYTNIDVRERLPFIHGKRNNYHNYNAFSIIKNLVLVHKYKCDKETVSFDSL